MLVDVRTTIESYGPPTKKIWITETNYNLLGPLIDDATARAYVNATYSYCSQEGVMQLYWYAWNRADLGGILFNDGSSGWAAVRDHA